MSIISFKRSISCVRKWIVSSTSTTCYCPFVSHNDVETTAFDIFDSFYVVAVLVVICAELF